MNRRYIAIDPGVGTGIATFADGRFHSYETFSIVDAATDVTSFYSKNAPCEVVSEMFLISQRTLKGKIYYDSLYFNGWLTITHPNAVLQTAAQAKGIVSDAMLHHLGWYKKTKDGHANDAARHLVHRAIRNRERWMLQQIGEFIA